MAVNYTNLNGSVNIGSSSKRDTWNSYNFFHTAIYQRTIILNGGDLTATERWWKTPLPYPPFNVRAPEDLLTETDWRSLRNWICDTVQGGWIDDVDFFNEHQGIGIMANRDITTKIVEATTGPNSTTTLSRDGDYVIHRFTQSDYLTVKSEGIVEYLLVGGGGAGGANYGGGGGGGGSVVTGFKRLPVGTYDIVIGAGGGLVSTGQDIGNTGLQGQAGKRDSTDGGNTTAFGITAYGGGAGAGTTTNSFAAVARVKDAPQATPFVVDNSMAIGSGGGGSAANPTGAFSSSHTKGSNYFGYRGGNGFVNGTTGVYLGGGGGGAGGPGFDANAWPLSNVVISNSTATSTVNSATINSNTITVTTATGTIIVGMVIYGSTAIPNGTFIKEISGTTLTLSHPTTAAISNASLTFGGVFTCESSPYLKDEASVIISGTNTGTGSITGYSSGNLYQIIKSTNGSFSLSTIAGADVTIAAGTLTGLLFTVTTRQAGAGGIGISSTISDTETYYGGGGAGGGHGTLDRGNVGGLGGGASSKDANQQSATTNDGNANTGGGGAGATGAAGVTGAEIGLGGSGIVIVRYPKNIGISNKPNKNRAAFGQPVV
jgi:hypothetical protein